MPNRVRPAGLSTQLRELKMILLCDLIRLHIPKRHARLEHRLHRFAVLPNLAQSLTPPQKLPSPVPIQYSPAYSWPRTGLWT